MTFFVDPDALEIPSDYDVQNPDNPLTVIATSSTNPVPGGSKTKEPPAPEAEEEEEETEDSSQAQVRRKREMTDKYLAGKVFTPQRRVYVRIPDFKLVFSGQLSFRDFVREIQDGSEEGEEDDDDESDEADEDWTPSSKKSRGNKEPAPPAFVDAPDTNDVTKF